MSNPKGNRNPFEQAAGGRNTAAGRGRGGRGMPQQSHEDDSDDSDHAPVAGGRGGMVVRGRGAGGRGGRPVEPESDSEDDLDDEDYDDFEDGGDDDEGEEEEQLDEIDSEVLAKHKAVMRRVVSDPASLAANHASELVETLSFLEGNIRAPNALEWFLTEEGFATLLALTRAVTGSAPLNGLEMTIDVSEHALTALASLSLSRKSLDVFVQYNLLPELYALFSKYSSEPKIMDQALEVLDNILQISQQRQQIANMIDGNLVNSLGENPEKLDVAALMGPDMRKPVLELGFVEWAVANLNSLSTQSSNLTMNIMYAMVDEEQQDGEYDDDSESEDESFNPKARFLAAGGVGALEKSLKGDIELMQSDDDKFDVAHALLALRLASNMILNNAEMAKAFGESDILEAAGAILSKVREDNFDADEPMEEDTEQLVICTIEFVSMFIDLLSNRDAVLETDIVDDILNFMEHAALGETSLVVSGEFRTVALNVLVSGLDVEGTQPHANRAFTQYLLKHDSAVETLLEMLEQGNDFDEDDEEAAYEAQERLENEAPTITDILTHLGESRSGAEALIKKGVDKKMFGMFDSAKAAAEQAEDPEEQSMAFDRLEKSLAVLTKLAVVPSVQKLLYDKKCEPVLRRLLTDDEGSEYVRVEVLGLLSNLIEGDKWSTAINARQKEFIDKPIRLMSSPVLPVRSAAVNYLASVAKVPVLAVALANKTAALTKLCQLANGVDEHEKQEKGEDDDDEDIELEDDEDELPEDEEDAESMALNAMSALINLARSSAAAPKLCGDSTFVASLVRALDDEQPDNTLRVIAALVIGQLTLVDKERAYVPAKLLAALESQVPDSLQLPVFSDDSDSEDGEIELTLDPTLEWEAATDIYPLLDSNHRATRRLGAYLTAIILSNPAKFSDIPQPTAAVRERLAAVAADSDSDSLASQFAKLTVQQKL